jgi:excisionase family DNA binding protein
MGKEIPMESNYLLEKSLLRPDEVAAFMRVCVKTVYRWCEEGKLEGVKIGKMLRFHQKSVIELLDKRGTEENAIAEEVYK